MSTASPSWWTLDFSKPGDRGGFVARFKGQYKKIIAGINAAPQIKLKNRCKIIIIIAHHCILREINFWDSTRNEENCHFDRCRGSEVGVWWILAIFEAYNLQKSKFRAFKTTKKVSSWTSKSHKLVSLSRKIRAAVIFLNFQTMCGKWKCHSVQRG